MGFLDSATGKANVQSTGGGGAGTGVPQSDLVSVGGGVIDTSFLDALYTGGKLTAGQRDAILSGSDPSSYGLNAYDLWNLTNGRLGSKSAASSSMPLILAWVATVVYQVGQVVTYQPPGSAGVGLYQAQQTVPVNTPPTTAGYWVQLVSPTAALISPYSELASYQVGQLVIYQPLGTQAAGLYQAKVAPPQVGIAPTVTSYWQQLVSPGPVVLFDADLLNPALAGLSAPASGVLGQLNTSGSALSAITIPAGRRYRLTVGEVRPNVAGGSTPTDSHFRLELLAAETLNAVDGTVSLVITPRWAQIATANAAAIAAQAANLFAARARVELV